MFRRKKKQEQDQQSVQKCGSTNLEKIDMPVSAPRFTFNFGDILRYFKYNMSSGMIVAAIERAVQRELAGRKDFPTRLFFGAVGVGIMVFMIFIGAMVFMQTAPSFAASAAQAAPPSLIG